MYSVGTILKKPCCFYKHVGVALGGGYVLHNAPSVGEQIISELEFMGSSAIDILEPPTLDIDLFRQRVAYVKRNPQPYSWTERNCEHTASWVLTGIAQSPQLQVFAMLALGAIVFWLLPYEPR